MYWYLILFVTAFVAASLFPGSPDAMLAYMMVNKNSILLSITVATIGSYLGACLNYYLGLRIHKVKFLDKFKPSEKEFAQSTQRFLKWGQISLFFSWVPFVGDPLTFVAGYLKLDFIKFSIWILLGRIFRFWLVASAASLVSAK